MTKRTCVVEDCSDPHIANGYCGKHLARVRRNGSPNLQRKPGYEERYWAKVDLDGPIPPHQPQLGPCWLWTAGLRSAYGTFGGKLVHRIMMEWVTKEPIPKALQVCHRCDTPRCVRPSHLFLGTSLDNMRDKMQKGRGRFPGPTNPAFGEAHPGARLSAGDVSMIRRLAPVGVTNLQLSLVFGVSPSLIQAVIARKIWKHVA